HLLVGHAVLVVAHDAHDLDHIAHSYSSSMSPPFSAPLHRRERLIPPWPGTGAHAGQSISCQGAPAVGCREIHALLASRPRRPWASVRKKRRGGTGVSPGNTLSARRTGCPCPCCSRLLPPATGWQVGAVPDPERRPGAAPAP